MSDGIPEAEDVDGTQFGLAQLEGYLRQPDPVSALFAATDEFCRGTHPQDDRTVLIIDRIA